VRSPRLRAAVGGRPPEGSYRAISRDVRGAVAKECEGFVRDHIARGLSFAVETTLRTVAAVEQADLARQRGFLTLLRFVATDSIDVNVARVLQRAQGGGHGASERDIRAIHQASIENLAVALATFDRTLAYDSTEAWTAPRLVASAQGGHVLRRGASPAWLERALRKRE
jgi:predicted ABC-type ATPase